MFRGFTLAPRVRAWHGGVCVSCPFPAFSVGSPIATPRPTNKSASTGRISGESPITFKARTEAIRDGSRSGCNDNPLSTCRRTGGQRGGQRRTRPPPPHPCWGHPSLAGGGGGGKYHLSKILSAKQNGIMRYHARPSNVLLCSWYDSHPPVSALSAYPLPPCFFLTPFQIFLSVYVSGCHGSILPQNDV